MTFSSPHIFLRYSRLIHLYLGVFTAPALLFFAFTGALQTFSLHETTWGSSYRPPAWAVTLAQLHKKQTPVFLAKKTLAPIPQTESKKAEGASDAAAATVPPSNARQHHPLPLKLFFLVVSISLLSSTISGIYMSYKYRRNRILVTMLLALGTAIPIALAFV